MKQFILALLLFLPSMALGQAFVSGQSFALNPFTGGFGPLSNAPVRVCTYPTSGSPCNTPAAITDIFGNPLVISGGNFGQLTTDIVGRYNFGCTSGANLQIQIAAAQSNTPSSTIVQTCGGSGSGGGGNPSGAVLLNPAGTQTVVQPPNTAFIVTSTISARGSGLLNGITFPDSGTNAQTISTNNTAGYFSGSVPVTNTLCPSCGGYVPIFSALVGNVPYSTQLEVLADKDQINGYPSLDEAGLVPQSELISSTGIPSCTSSTVVVGDFSGCISPGGSPTFAQILAPGAGSTSTNVGPGTYAIGSGLTLTFSGSGNINASSLNSTSWPSGALGGPFNTLNAIPVVVSANVSGATIGATIPPNCIAVGCALGFNQTTHQFVMNTVALNSAHPMVLLPCNDANNSCPNTASVSGVSNNTNTIVEQYTIPANTLSTDGQCVRFHEWFKHDTGTASVTYSWNVGGTGSAGTGVVGGFTTNTANSSVSGSAVLTSFLYICRASGSLETYVNTDQWQFGTAQAAGSLNEFAIDWTQTQTVNFMFNVANVATDTVKYWGGFLNYL